MKNLLFVLPFLFLLTACDDESGDDLTPRLTEAEAGRAAALTRTLFGSQATMQRGYEQTQVAARQESELSDNVVDPNGKTDPDACPQPTFKAAPGTFFPATLLLDYGDCDKDADLALSGSILATFDGFIVTPGATTTIDFSSFTANDYGVSGRYRQRNDSLDAQGRQAYDKSVERGEFSRNDTLLFTYQQDGTSTQVAGQETNFFTNGLDGIYDDRFEDEYTGGGNLADGSAYTVETTNPLVTQLGCDYYTAGTLTYAFDSLSVPVVVDFGDGSCDDRATMSVGDFDFEIDLN